MACRFWLLRSEVSISIPNETASEGAAIPLGRFAGAFADVTGFPRKEFMQRVFKNQKGAFFSL